MRPLTEYRRKYKEKGPACHDDYLVRYEYVVGRRSTEMRHTPIDWNSSESSDSEENVPIAQSVVSRREKRDGDGVSNNKSSSIRHEKGVSVAVQADRNGIKCDNKITEKDEEKARVANEANQNENDLIVKSISKKKRRHRKNKNSEKEKADTRDEPKAPLLPYGWAYRGPIDNHKTYNVKVSQKEACESALRAQKRREFEIKKREEEKKMQSLQKKRTDALFNYIEDEKDGWISEYKRNFSGHHKS